MRKRTTALFGSVLGLGCLELMFTSVVNAQVRPPRDPESLRSEGIVFRAKVIAALAQQPPKLLLDLSDLCKREKFDELSAHEFEIKMQGAGQPDRAAIVEQRSPGGIAKRYISGGFAISSTPISHSVFMISVDAVPLNIQTGRVTEVQSCGVRSAHL